MFHEHPSFVCNRIINTKCNNKQQKKNTCYNKRLKIVVQKTETHIYLHTYSDPTWQMTNTNVQTRAYSIKLLNIIDGYGAFIDQEQLTNCNYTSLTIMSAQEGKLVKEIAHAHTQADVHTN